MMLEILCSRCKGSGEIIDDVYEEDGTCQTRLLICGKCGGAGVFGARDDERLPGD